MRGGTTDIGILDPKKLWEMTEPDNLLLTSERFHAALNALSAVSAPCDSPEGFFRTCVAEIAEAYQTRFAFIGMVSDPERPDEISTIASFGDGNLIPNIKYPLDGSPCRQVLHSNHLFIPKGLSDRYPDDEMLVEMGLDSYYGSALFDSKGNKVGIVVVCDTKPMALDPWIYPLLDLFASRISHEIERSRHLSELLLTSSVYENCNDAVVIVGPDFRIMKANRTFETITGWSEQEIFGKPIRVLRSGYESKDFYKRVTRELQQEGSWSGELWLRRKNDNIFPSDSTLTAVKHPITGQNTHYVMILSDQSQRKYAEERIHRLAYYDPATELPNRTCFLQELKKALSKQRRTGEEFAVMIMDLDNFKAVNDRLGHIAGDALVKQVASRLRDLDADCFTVARIGGDEFAALCFPSAGGTTTEKVGMAAQKVLSVLQTPFSLEGETVSITTSIGIALSQSEECNANVLLRNADLAIYHAKDQGRNRIEFFQESLCEKAEKHALLSARLRSALAGSQFHLVYQPKFNVADSQPIGAEALLRWRLDDGSFISPANFIPVAEETGLICDIGHWVLQEAFEQSVSWTEKNIPFGKISVNLSGRQMLASDFLQRVTNLVQNTNVDTRHIELEITETWLMEDPARARELLHSLKTMGFSLSIDDFGVAYSSMNYLRHFPVDVIKIDRSFIRDMEHEKSSMAIVSAITAMGHSLDLQVLAEGVETDAQLNILKTLGCDLCQGFLFAKPLEANDFVAVVS